MTRFASAVLLALLLGAAGCASGSQQPPPQAPADEPTEPGVGSEETAPEPAGVEAEQGQPVGPSGTTGGSGSDRDGDGTRDDMDRCPDEPEDRDGFEDQDGCPDPDNDRDGIVDLDDKCPAEPEARNGRQDEDGCPD